MFAICSHPILWLLITAVMLMTFYYLFLITADLENHTTMWFLHMDSDKHLKINNVTLSKLLISYLSLSLNTITINPILKDNIWELVLISFPITSLIPSVSFKSRSCGLKLQRIFSISTLNHLSQSHDHLSSRLQLSFYNWFLNSTLNYVFKIKSNQVFSFKCSPITLTIKL